MVIQLKYEKTYELPPYRMWLIVFPRGTRNKFLHIGSKDTALAEARRIMESQKFYGKPKITEVFK